MIKRCPICDGENDTCDRCAGLGVINVPTAIYLQINEIDFDITWCEDRINDNDLEYRLVTPSKPDTDAEEFKTPNDNHILEQR